MKCEPKIIPLAFQISLSLCLSKTLLRTLKSFCQKKKDVLEQKEDDGNNGRLLRWQHALSPQKKILIVPLVTARWRRGELGGGLGGEEKNVNQPTLPPSLPPLYRSEILNLLNCVLLSSLPSPTLKSSNMTLPLPYNWGWKDRWRRRRTPPFPLPISAASRGGLLKRSVITKITAATIVNDREGGRGGARRRNRSLTCTAEMGGGGGVVNKWLMSGENRRISRCVRLCQSAIKTSV